MKVQLQLSIDHLLKDRLKRLSDHTGIPISKLVTELLEKGLVGLEKRFELKPEPAPEPPSQ